MSDDYTVTRWGSEPRPVPRWLVDKVTRLGEVSSAVTFGLPLDDAPAAFTATAPPAPDPGEVVATIERYLSREPTHTLLVSEEHADRARRAVGDAWLGLDVEVVESPYMPVGEAILIDRSAFKDAWRKPEPTTSWAEAARRVAERGSAAVIKEEADA